MKWNRGARVLTTERLPRNGTAEDFGVEEPPADTPADSSAESLRTESGFESFFLRNYSRVVSLLMRIVGDRARAEELADDAFLKLYHQPLPTDRQHNIEAWFYRTASRMGIDALRATARRTRIESLAASDGIVGTSTDCPLGSLLQSESQLQVRKALARLRPAEAQILILRSSGFSYKEIAASLGIRPGSVGTLLNRAESAFEKSFNELFGAAGHGAPKEKNRPEQQQ